jgi:bacillolysin
MPRACLLAVLLALLAGMAWAESTDGPVFGPNRLRDNKRLTTYREDTKGNPVYVEGDLAESEVGENNVQTAIRFFEEQKGAYRMASPAEELHLRRADQDELGMRHVRFDQRYRNVPVIGGELAAHFTPAGQLKTVNGRFYSDIDLDVNAIVSADEAVRTSADDLLSFFGKTVPGEPELVVFPWENAYYLCWHLFLRSSTPMGRWEYFIDAGTGEVVFKANRIMNENDIGTGYGVMGGSRSHIDTRLNGSVYEMRDYTRQSANNPHGHDGQMPAGNYIQTNLAGASLPGTIATDPDNVWTDSATQRPAVDGQVYTALMYDWLLDSLGRNGFNGNGASMIVSVNYYAEGTNNAYWNGEQIVVWSWATGWRSLAGCPDVIAHEWGHAVTEYCSNLIYQKESGALNESFSDMMGAAFEFAHPTYDTPDWGMGENGRTTGVGFRSMEDPHLFGDPDYYGLSDPYWIDVEGCTPSDANDYCGVHTNSGVGNKWFQLLSDGGTHYGVTVAGIGVSEAIRIAYRANDIYWTSNTNYTEGALGSLSAANDLDPTGAWATQVALAWNAVGVPTPGPSLVFSYPEGTPSLLTPDGVTAFEVVINGTLGGSMVAGSGLIHYALDGGSYTTAALTPITSNRFEASLPGAACGGTYRFYVSAEETSAGVISDPDPSTPNVAVAADSTRIAFQDNFETNKGWSVSGNAFDGQWSRGVPVGGGERGDPPTDYDGSGQCFLTDNVYGNSDVDDGTTYLTSPVFSLAAGNGIVSYARWYSNDFGNAPHADVMKVYISNDTGLTWTVVETIGPTEQASGGWYEHSFWAGDFVTPTGLMRLRFEASDLADGSVVEAAVDAVLVTSFLCGSSPGPLEVTTESVPDWTAGHPYAEQLTAAGGTGPYAWLDKFGDLAETGLSLSADGLLSGTPTAPGTIAFTARVTDQNNSTADRALALTVNAALTVTTTILPDWTAGVSYYQQLNATGGTGTRAWSDQYSQLASTGLILSSVGVLSGIPTTVGPISFTAQITDQVGATGRRVLTFTLNPPVSITASPLPVCTLGVTYQQQLQATGGTGAQTWSDRDGALAGTGLVLSSQGIMSGMPVDTGLISFVVRAIDAVGGTDEQLFELLAVRSYVCGDANGDETVSVGDAVFLINHVFNQGPAAQPPEAGDANCDGSVNVGDAVYLINLVFKGGPPPCCP